MTTATTPKRYYVVITRTNGLSPVRTMRFDYFQAAKKTFDGAVANYELNRRTYGEDSPFTSLKSVELFDIRQPFECPTLSYTA